MSLIPLPITVSSLSLPQVSCGTTGSHCSAQGGAAHQHNKFQAARGSVIDQMSLSTAPLSITWAYPSPAQAHPTNTEHMLS